MNRLVLLLSVFVGFCFSQTFDGKCPDTFIYQNTTFYKTYEEVVVDAQHYMTVLYGFVESESCARGSGSPFYMIYAKSDNWHKYYGDGACHLYVSYIYYTTIPPDNKTCPQNEYPNNGICTPIPNCSKEIKGSNWNPTSKICECPLDTSNINGNCINDNDTQGEEKDGDEGNCKVPVGSYVIPKDRSFHEDIDILGSDITLHYSSQRTIGYKNPLYPFIVNDIASGWTLSNIHHYDNQTLFLGNGEVIEYKDYEITVLKSGNTIVYDKSHIGHEFDTKGRLIRSFDPKSNADIYAFTYDKKSGLLTSIKDRYSRVTKLNRDSNGKVLSIQSAFGHLTYLDIDNFNNLISVSYEDGSNYRFDYNDEHLLTSKTNPRNYTYRYEYNTNGRVSKIVNPLYNEYLFSSSLKGNNEAVSSFTTPEGTSYGYSNSKTDDNGIQLSSSKNPFGLETTVITSNDKRDIQKSYCGITEKLSYDIDELSLQNRLSSIIKTMPSGLTNTQNLYTYYTKRGTSAYKDTSTITSNSKTSTITTDYYTGKRDILTPEDRKTTVNFDKNTYLPKSIVKSGISTINYTYNSKKQLTRVSQGARRNSYTYDVKGNIATIKDASGATYSYTYDSKDRLTSVKNPNNMVTYYEYDDNDNLISVLNPNSYVNSFDYNPLDQETEWNSPLGYKTYYEYDKDKRLTKTVKPSGKTISYSYTNNQLSKTTTDEGIYNYSYDCLGQISSINTNANEKTNHQYDGELLTNIRYEGTLNQDISFAYNNDFLPSSITYSNEKEEFAYDKDNLLISSNNAILSRDKSTGLITKLADNNNLFERSITYSSFGEQDKITDKINKKSIYAQDITSVSNQGKILKKTETLYDRTINYTYVYDKHGRLTKSTQNHKNIKNQKPNSYNYIEEFSYDNQGNILKHTITDKNQKTIKQGIYDIDDRTKIFDNTNYVYNTDGYLISKIDNEGETTYTYGTLGELREVVLPNNTKVTYIYNANNQRSAKLINNEIQEKYLWLNLTTLLAIYDKDDNLITRFYYLDDRVPYKVKHNNQIYYLSYNHIGSLKQVTDANGQNIKSIIYSAYGNIIHDTNPNLNIPLGFAGGLYDKDTKLTKFGYREYDSYTGRWTSKDPIRYEGGDSNLYGYVLNDPVNFVDPSGLEWQVSIGVSGSAGVGLFGGGGTSIGITSGGRLFIRFTANTQAGAGIYGGVGGEIGVSHADCPSEAGMKTETQAIGSANIALFYSGGGSIEGTSLTNIGVSRGGAHFGVGGGVRVSGGVSTTTTITSPTIGEMWDWIISPF